jgi:hypothetical protein
LTNLRSAGSVDVGSTGTAPTDAATAAPPLRSANVLPSMPPPITSSVPTDAMTSTPTTLLRLSARTAITSTTATDASTATENSTTSRVDLLRAVR